MHPRVLARLNQKVLVHPRASLPFQIPKELLDPKGGVPAQVPTRQSPDNAPHLWPIYADLGLQVPDTAPGIQRRVDKAKDLLKKIGITKN